MINSLAHRTTWLRSDLVLTEYDYATFLPRRLHLPYGFLMMYRISALAATSSISRRPSGLRKTNQMINSLAHRTTWLRSDLPWERKFEGKSRLYEQKLHIRPDGWTRLQEVPKSDTSSRIHKVDADGAAGTLAPGPITRRETAVCHKWHVRWCERGTKVPLLNCECVFRYFTAFEFSNIIVACLLILSDMGIC